MNIDWARSSIVYDNTFLISLRNMDQIRLLAPATVSNVVCGFDCLGFALEAPCDEMTVRLIDSRQVRILNRGPYDLPSDPENNVAGAALLALMEKLDDQVGFEVEFVKHIKPGSGIGSSSASSCGAVVGANKLLGERFSRLELVDFAMAGEKVASGEKHADNVAPCIFGGFVIVRSIDPLDIIALDSPPLFATVIHPQIEIKTSEARAILPKEVPLKAAVKQWSNLGALVAGLAQGDSALIARSMEDFIVEPVRKALIPKFDEVKAASLAAGALGGGISGSGPSMFMLSETAETAQAVENTMHTVYSQTRIEFHTYVSAINPHGVRVV
jgi:homoserine kinase